MFREPQVAIWSLRDADRGRAGEWALSLTPASPRELELLPTGPRSPKKPPLEGITPLGATFLPDGRIVVFHSAPGEPRLFSIVGPEGGRPANILIPGRAATGGFAFSPDSRLVAYATRERQVAVLPIAGGSPRAVPGAILEPTERLFQWSADERYLFTVRNDDVPARIWRLDIETGKKALWKEVLPADASGLIRLSDFCVTRDGRSYAYSYTRMDSDDLYIVEGLKETQGPQLAARATELVAHTALGWNQLARFLQELEALRAA